MRQQPTPLCAQSTKSFPEGNPRRDSSRTDAMSVVEGITISCLNIARHRGAHQCCLHFHMLLQLGSHQLSATFRTFITSVLLAIYRQLSVLALTHVRTCCLQHCFHICINVPSTFEDDDALARWIHHLKDLHTPHKQLVTCLRC